MNENGRNFVVIKVEGEGMIRVMQVNGVNAPIYVLKSKHALLFSRFRMISKELSFVYEALNELITDTYKSGIIIQSLSTAAVITYGKCFSQADGRKIKLDESSLKYADDNLRTLHNELISMRNTYIAHGGIGNYEQNPVCLAVNPLEESDIVKVYDNLTYTNSIESKAKMFLELISFVNKFVDEKIKIHYDKLIIEVNQLKIADIKGQLIYPEKMEKAIIKATGKAGN